MKAEKDLLISMLIQKALHHLGAEPFVKLFLGGGGLILSRYSHLGLLLLGLPARFAGWTIRYFRCVLDRGSSSSAAMLFTLPISDSKVDTKQICL